MPTPVSVIDTSRNRLFVSYSLYILTLTVTEPSIVNFIAFCNKFKRTC
jgi:hypothetical protein